MVKTAYKCLIIYACLLLFGFFATRHLQYLLSLSLLYSLVAIGLVILIGYGGLVSFGQGAFYAIGAYSVGLLLKYYGFQNAEILLVLGVLITTLISFLIGLLAARTRKLAFAMITVAFSMIIYTLLVKFYHITGGTDGLRIPAVKLFGILPVRGRDLFMSMSNEYFIIITIFTIILYITEHVINSPLSYALRAVKDAELKAVSLGISPTRVYILAFTYAGFLAGIAGTLYAFLNAHIDPLIAFWTTSGEFVFITILGGITSIYGVFLASILYLFLKTYLIVYTAYYWQFVIGFVILLLILLAPKGLSGIIFKVYIGRKVFRKS